MQTILYEQLPPELFDLVQSLRDEIADLRKTILEGDFAMITEQQFNELAGRVTATEEGLKQVQETIALLQLDGESVESLQQSVKTINEAMATLSSYDFNNSKVVTKMQEAINSMETKHAAMAAKELTVSAMETSSDIVLPTTDDYMSRIEWSSSHPEYLAEDGTVTQPPYSVGSVLVTLTATVWYGSSFVTKDFEVLVLPLVDPNPPVDTEPTDPPVEPTEPPVGTEEPDGTEPVDPEPTEPPTGSTDETDPEPVETPVETPDSTEPVDPPVDGSTEDVPEENPDEIPGDETVEETPVGTPVEEEPSAPSVDETVPEEPNEELPVEEDPVEETPVETVPVEDSTEEVLPEEPSTDTNIL